MPQTLASSPASGSTPSRRFTTSRRSSPSSVPTRPPSSVPLPPHLVSCARPDLALPSLSSSLLKSTPPRSERPLTESRLPAESSVLSRRPFSVRPFAQSSLADLGVDPFPLQTTTSTPGLSSGSSPGSVSLDSSSPSPSFPVRLLVLPSFPFPLRYLRSALFTDTTGLDLREQERYWRFVRAGRAEGPSCFLSASSLCLRVSSRADH